jgi:hypothetical protein
MNTSVMFARVSAHLVILGSLLAACMPVGVGPGGTTPLLTPTPVSGGSDLSPTPETAVGGTMLVPTATPAADGIPFAIVAEGAPFVSAGETPVLFAFRNDGSAGALPAGLPDEAKAALEKVLAQPDSALYAVVFLGKQPSTGYGVQLSSITRATSGDAGLVVSYTFEKPDPAKGGATVMTYPYVIARVQESGVAPQNVVFSESPGN